MMNGDWSFPDPDKLLENSAVVLSKIKLDTDLEELFAAASIENNGEDLFRFHLNAGPFHTVREFYTYLDQKVGNTSDVTYKVYSKRLAKIVGCLSLINIKTEHGTMEVGAVWYSREAQKTEINSNAMYLLFCYVFEVLSYRRLEWKCNNQNLDSKRAALRLGFEFEGIFRHHFISRGVNRDTAWFSIIDAEWPQKKAALQAKLADYPPA